MFDSSRGFLKQPFQFQIGAGDVIKGWDQVSAHALHILCRQRSSAFSSMGGARPRVRSRPPVLGAGNAQDEQGREGHTDLHARLRMCALTDRTKSGLPRTRHPAAPHRPVVVARRGRRPARRAARHPARRDPGVRRRAHRHQRGVLLLSHPRTHSACREATCPYMIMSHVLRRSLTLIEGSIAIHIFSRPKITAKKRACVRASDQRSLRRRLSRRVPG